MRHQPDASARDALANASGWCSINTKANPVVGAGLIPKRCLIDVLTAEDATVDGVHLSRQGHQLMAETVWRVVGGGACA